jgi:hypothetical protein
VSRARGDSLLWFRLSGFHSTDGWKSIGRVFVLALVLDVVYQIIAEHFVYPGEAITVAIVLALVPYLILGGLVNRWARKE